MAKEADNQCVHCGADCGRHPVEKEELKFCCEGCATVYSLLHEHQLYKYYDLEDNPGIRIETTFYGNKYAFLDKDEIREKLISFSEGGISKVRFFIPVIHCASCIWLLEKLHLLNPGIRHAFVNFSRKEVDITFAEKEISLRQLVELLASIHYIPDLSQSLQDKGKEGSGYKKLLYKLGIAGFVFINVMTYSLPAYFNGEPLDDKLQNLFSILSFILVIPVVFYSGSDYYASSLKSILKKNISIDLPIALGISVLFGVTACEVISGSGPGYSDSLSGLIFFLLVGKWYQGKTYEALSFERNYRSYFPIAVTKINRQVEESVLLEDLQAGDEILIRNRELIPADAVLLEGSGRIDYSFVSGESTPVLKQEGEFIYAGGRQMGELIRIRLEKEVSQSHLTKLWNQDRSYEKPSDSLKSLSDRISRYFTLVIISIALLAGAWWMLRGESHQAIFVFTAVLIVACPCALALSIPFTFGSTMRIFGRHGLYIKNTAVIERLAHIDTIVFDKTGTLTQPNQSRVEYHGKDLAAEDRDTIHSLTRQSTHPLSAAIASWLDDAHYHQPEHFVEVPGRGIFGKVGEREMKLGSYEYVHGVREDKGAEGSPGTEVAEGSSGAEAPPDAEGSPGAEAPPDAEGSPGAGTRVYFSPTGDGSLAYFTLGNRYREGVEEVLGDLGKEFDMYMVSGDNAAEREVLQKYFAGDHLHFEQKPGDKADFIRRLQEKGQRVLMTGDGLNDGIALNQSDVALTVANKVYHFSPASDAVMEADHFRQLATFIHFARTSLKVVWASFIISFCYNIIGIAFAVTGQLSPVVAAILMPISSVSVVAFASFSTRLLFRLRKAKN